MPHDLVVFRKWNDCGGVIALFPELPADVLGRFCLSYEHIGQHGGADYHAVVSRTTPARPPEFAALARELARIGYELRPIQRASARHLRRRLEAARA